LLFFIKNLIESQTQLYGQPGNKRLRSRSLAMFVLSDVNCFVFIVVFHGW